MARARKRDRRRLRLALAALALLAGCGQPHRHNSAENEFTAWANDVEAESANGQAETPDFEEPANIMARIVPANAQQGGGVLKPPAADHQRPRAHPWR